LQHIKIEQSILPRMQVTRQAPETSRPDVRLLTIPINSGKTIALAKGIENATCELILTIDADLRGLTTRAST